MFVSCSSECILSFSIVNLCTLVSRSVKRARQLERQAIKTEECIALAKKHGRVMVTFLASCADRRSLNAVVALVHVTVYIYRTHYIISDANCANTVSQHHRPSRR